MSLKIFYSDRIEVLAAELKRELANERSDGADPFAFSQVVVPNANIAKYLQMREFAKEEKLCAGIKFPFMEACLTQIMQANLEAAEEFKLLPDHAYTNAILRILLKNDSPKLKPFRAYIDGGEGAFPIKIEKQRDSRMAWQLADKLANLMDTYEVRRPEIIANWLAGGSAANVNTPPTGTESAEAELAKSLWGENGEFPNSGNRLSLRQLYERVKNTAPKRPSQTIYFFGQSTLTLLQVRIFLWLAQTHDVIFYHNNPCLAYWGDIETAKERRKTLFKVESEFSEQNPDASFDWRIDDKTIENPLLTKFGIAGRETLRLLVDLEEECDGTIDFEWREIFEERGEGESVLEKVQHGIRRRTSEMEKVPQDASIQIVGAPGIRREVEMVYNSIVGSVWKPDGSGDRPWSDCTFSDIAVLVPDMATYRPIIEAVFDARGQVPYGLIDTTASEDSQYLAGFLALGELARNGLTRETLFAVLENPCVQQALKFTGDDVAEWRELTKSLGAFDGFEQKNDDDYFCWEWALSRLRLGQVADVLGCQEDHATNSQPCVALPLVMRGGRSGLRLSEIVELIYRELRSLRDKRLPCVADDGEANWASTFARLANEFLAVSKDDVLESSVRRDVLRTLNSLTEIESQTFEFPIAAVEHLVGGVSCCKGGYLTHGVTFAGLLPMRPVPFKQVYVLGLGAGGFPGRTSSSTLDIRGTGWRLGDVSIPDANRYLFLETLMAVRERLVLCYPNRDIEKDAELFPSGIIRELTAFIDKCVINDTDQEGAPLGFREFKGYPLLEHGEDMRMANVTGERYCDATADVVWNKDDPHAGILPSYSAAARLLANERRKTAVPEVTPISKTDDAQNGDVTARELAQFVRDPLRAVMRHRFGIGVEGYRDKQLDPDSPLDISDSLTLRNLQRELFEVAKDRKTSSDQEAMRNRLDAICRKLQLAGGAPSGVIGNFALGQVRKAFEEKIDALVKFVEEFENLDASENNNTESKWDYGKIGTSHLPPDCTLEPLLAFLMKLANGDCAEERGIKIGVVDISSGSCGSWEWKATREKAEKLISGLTEKYYGFLKREVQDATLPIFDYWKLMNKLESGTPPYNPDFEMLAQAMADEGYSPKKKSSFNNALVIEKVLQPQMREATADELREMFNDFYRYLLGEHNFVTEDAAQTASGEVAQ